MTKTNAQHAAELVALAAKFGAKNPAAEAKAAVAEARDSAKRRGNLSDAQFHSRDLAELEARYPD